jgi:thiosulfate dehydrogenase (quinone) large subunit
MAQGVGTAAWWRSTASRYALLPLRMFLGVTFIYAGLNKLSSAGFWADSGSGSLVDQLHGVEKTAALPAMIHLALGSPDAFGLAIAFGELLVGLGTLFGLWARVAALGGALISSSLWLTVGWQVQPYFLNNDLTYLMAWLPLVLAGAPVLSADAWLAARRARLEASGAARWQVRRRAVLDGGLAAAVLVACGALGSGLAGGVWKRGEARRGGSARSGEASNPGPGETATAVVTSSAVPVGGAARTVDPSSGEPAYIVQPRAGTYAAFSAICTHEGCVVRGPRDRRFSCPCHGAEFDAATGRVLKGPATEPLPKLPVRRAGNRLELR